MKAKTSAYFLKTTISIKTTAFVVQFERIGYKMYQKREEERAALFQRIYRLKSIIKPQTHRQRSKCTVHGKLSERKRCGQVFEEWRGYLKYAFTLSHAISAARK